MAPKGSIYCRVWWRQMERSRRSEEMRRLRPNLVIGGVQGLEERTWPGSTIRIGEVLIAVVDLRGRRVMTTFDPDTLAHDPEVLQDIVRRFGGKLAPNCQLVKGGESFTISNRWISPGRDPTGCVGKVTGLAPCLTVNPVIRRYFSLRPEFGKQIASL